MRSGTIAKGLGSALLASSCLMPGTAMAQGLVVLPTVVDIPAGRSGAAIEVRNRATAPVAVQLSAFGWSQPAGEDRLTDDPHVLVSPSIATIAPGAVQTFRLIIPAGPRLLEKSWRIILDQLPPPASQAAPATAVAPLTVRLRLSIPLFAAADDAGAPDLRWRRENGAVIAANRGTRRIRFGALQVDGAPLPLGSSPYLLPGAERRWPWAGGLPLHVAGQADTGAIDASLSRLAAE